MKSLKLLTLGALSLSLAACGGSIQNKEDAVKVLQRMESMGAGSSSGMDQGLGSNLIMSNTVSLSGQSGTATCEVSLDIPFLGDESAQMTYDVRATMSNFSPDGVNTYDGTESLHWVLAASATENEASASASMTMTADMTVAGDYNNHVVANVTLTMAASVVAATSGSATMTIDGTITVDGTTYTYDNETFTVEAGQ